MYNGYKITKDKDGTYRVAVGDKVVNVGLRSEEYAKLAVDARRTKRARMGLEPAG